MSLNLYDALVIIGSIFIIIHGLTSLLAVYVFSSLKEISKLIGEYNATPTFMNVNITSEEAIGVLVSLLAIEAAVNIGAGVGILLLHAAYLKYKSNIYPMITTALAVIALLFGGGFFIGAILVLIGSILTLVRTKYK